MTMELSTEQISSLIKDGKQLNLFEDLYQNGRVIIGKERVLTLKDIERISDKVHGKLRVVEIAQVDITDEQKKLVVSEVERFLKERKDYKGMKYEKRKKTGQLILNILPHNDYIIKKIYDIYKFSKKLYAHSLNVAIKSLILDSAWQERYNNGLVDSLQSEHIFYGAILHDIGKMKLDKKYLASKLIEVEDEEEFQEHPKIGYEILIEENKYHKFPVEVLDIVLQHEEKLDGSGYPHKLQGNQISLKAQIVGLANEFENYYAGELTFDKRPFSQISRKLMTQTTKFDKTLINIIFEQFRYLA